MHPKSPEQSLKAGFRQGWLQFNCDKWVDKTVSAHRDIKQRSPLEQHSAGGSRRPDGPATKAGEKGKGIKGRKYC